MAEIGRNANNFWTQRKGKVYSDDWKTKDEWDFVKGKDMAHRIFRGGVDQSLKDAAW